METKRIIYFDQIVCSIFAVLGVKYSNTGYFYYFDVPLQVNCLTQPVFSYRNKCISINKLNGIPYGKPVILWPWKFFVCSYNK